ncbi:MAG: hypothetical protein RL065_29 [Bacteroidota bacterium]|jgi:hypothetical protein
MKTLFFYLFFFCSILFCKAQNLIPNSGFEIYDTCPDAPAQLKRCIGWYSPTVTTPDYFYRCSDTSITPPIVQDGVYQWPHTEKGEIGLCLIQPNNAHVTYREYAQIKLNQKLTKGNRYRYSQYYNCGVSPVSGSALMLASNNSGVLFSTWAISNFAPFVTFPNFCFIPQKPKINFSHINADTANWTLVTAEFVADSAYEYLTIGNFMADSLTSHFGIGDTTSLGPNSYGAYYLYDDVSLIDLGKDSANGMVEVKGKSAIILYPNPFTETLTINTAEVIKQIFVFDILGKVVYEKDNIGNCSYNINLKNLQSGIYTIKTIGNNSVSIQKILKE